MKNSIDPKIIQITQNLRHCFQDIVTLTDHVNNEDLKNTIQQLYDQLESPFTFVIVGEVKAGKSSFINALLDANKEICRVAPSPMTDTIQQIVYGKNESEIHINPFLKKITQPIDILQEIAIVDTPGTNTIVDHHQEITERFIPFSDLIVFVFEAKNPYRQSAWEFFDYIHEQWHRKVLFVLQQKDLMSPDDLTININGVIEHATKKGIPSPRVFAVSAKQEIENLKEESGYAPLRSFIKENITGGQAPYLKLQNTINTALSINTTIKNSLALRREQYELDVIFRKDIKETLEKQHTKTTKHIGLLVENLIANYVAITAEKEKELQKGLSLAKVLKKSISGIFSSGKGTINEWLKGQTNDLEINLNRALKDRLHEGIMDVADNIQMMGKIVDSKIKNSTTVLTDSDEIFSDIAEKRANVLKDLHQSFEHFLSKSENFYDQSLVEESSKMAPNLATGGGIAIVGVILTTVVNGAVFDITGGILTTIGIFFASISLGLNRRKIMNRFREEVQKGKIKLSEDIELILNSYTNRIKNRINDNFVNFDQHLLTEENTLNSLESKQSSIQITLEDQINQLGL